LNQPQNHRIGRQPVDRLWRGRDVFAGCVLANVASGANFPVAKQATFGKPNDKSKEAVFRGGGNFRLSLD
jgi:hypothetical protein